MNEKKALKQRLRYLLMQIMSPTLRLPCDSLAVQVIHFVNVWRTFVRLGRIMIKERALHCCSRVNEKPCSPFHIVMILKSNDDDMMCHDAPVELTR